MGLVCLPTNLPYKNPPIHVGTNIRTVRPMPWRMGSFRQAILWFFSRLRQEKIKLEKTTLESQEDLQSNPKMATRWFKVTFLGWLSDLFKG